MSVPTLVLATTNPGKAAEFRALLGRDPALARLAVATPPELGFALPPIEETGETFAENAALKARALAEATGLPALADDSGLCVDALGGAPGLHSARWAGAGLSDADRVHLLLQRLTGVPPEERIARFVCAAALGLPGGPVHIAEGVCEGRIIEAPRGTHGFGYDPIFLLPGLGRTMAELTTDEKNALSHRARALAALQPCLQALLAT